MPAMNGTVHPGGALDGPKPIGRFRLSDRQRGVGIALFCAKKVAPRQLKVMGAQCGEALREIFVM